MHLRNVSETRACSADGARERAVPMPFWKDRGAGSAGRPHAR